MTALSKFSALDQPVTLAISIVAFTSIVTPGHLTRTLTNCRPEIFVITVVTVKAIECLTRKKRLEYID